MRLISRVIGALIVLLLIIVVGGAIWLSLYPPELLRVGDGYAAKIVCSNTFVAKRDPDKVLEEDVQAPGNPALKLIRVSVDRDEGIVTARFLGLFAPNYALYRGALGCTAVPDGDLQAARSAVFLNKVKAPKSDALWPDGDAVSAGQGEEGAKLANIVANPDLAGPAMRAIVVVKDGHIVAEGYGDGFNRATPLIGWSMTKTVNAAIIGRLMLAGRMSFDDQNLLPQWSADDRKNIKLSDLLAMESGLVFNESYGNVSDVTRMLYLDPDTTSIASGARQVEAPGERFSYSSGTATLLSRLWMNRLPNLSVAVSYPREALFGPLGMYSAVLEADERGTFVGSSYLYANARDWARFGQFLLQDGVWNGHRLLPEGFVGAMRTPTKASEGVYSQVQAWLAGPGGSNAQFGLPADTFWMSGHDGQTVAIVPSANLVVVRMGLTPAWAGYRPQILLKRIMDVIKPASS
ncbi:MULTISPECIES: serine hydrolase [unclassified Rhizobium]|uniref:serine hydrolase domain-containing protein n=1 Tax=unclassified Rhizobium TaxID=2613769 RepID=UPI000EAA95B1|nr:MULTISPECIES: serine hydrolase [unclassified Rhizobium]AYG66695.1 class C beta-lactamase-related serine hydrolase [Rhizobium sp. CCGE531]AYG73075.1 class C beta-lactamase-related serine hydrolase [Rhizobium sp. CCGE532]